MNWSLLVYFLAVLCFVVALVFYIQEEIVTGIILSVSSVILILIGGFGFPPSSSPRIPGDNDGGQLGRRNAFVRTDFRSARTQVSAERVQQIIRKFAEAPLEDLTPLSQAPVPAPPAPPPVPALPPQGPPKGSARPPKPAPEPISAPVKPEDSPAPPPAPPPGSPVGSGPPKGDNTKPKTKPTPQPAPREKIVTNEGGFNALLASQLQVSEKELQKAIGKDGLLTQEGYLGLKIKKELESGEIKEDGVAERRKELEENSETKAWLTKTQATQKLLKEKEAASKKAQKKFKEETSEREKQLAEAESAKELNEAEKERFREDTKAREAELTKLDGQLAGTEKKVEVEATIDGDQYVYKDPNTGIETRVKIKYNKKEDTKATKNAQKLAREELKERKNTYQQKKEKFQLDLNEYNKLVKDNKESEDGLSAKQLDRASKLQARLAALFSKQGNVEVPYLAKKYSKMKAGKEKQLYEALFVYPTKKDDPLLAATKAYIMTELNLKGKSYDENVKRVKTMYAKGENGLADWSRIFGEKPYDISVGQKKITRPAGWTDALRRDLAPDLSKDLDKFIGGATFDAFKRYNIVADVARVTDPFQEKLEGMDTEKKKQKLREENPKLAALNASIQSIKNAKVGKRYELMGTFVTDQQNKINLAEFKVKPDLPSFGKKINTSQLGAPPPDTIDAEKFRVFTTKAVPPEPREYDNPAYKDIKKKKKALKPVVPAKIVPVPAVAPAPAVVPALAVKVSVAAVPAVAPKVKAAVAIAVAPKVKAAVAPALASKAVSKVIPVATLKASVVPKTQQPNPSNQLKAKVGGKIYRSKLITAYGELPELGKDYGETVAYLDTTEGQQAKKEIDELVIQYQREVDPYGIYE